MKSAKFLSLAVTLSLCVVFSGCTKVQQFAAIGGSAGALTGGLWANSAGNLSMAEGAMVGAAGGGLIGALIGDQFENDSSGLRSEISNLERQLAAKTAMLDDQGKVNEQLRSEIKNLTDRIKDLETKLANAENDLKSKENDMALVDPKNDDIQVEKTDRGIEYTILGSILFDPGSSTLSASGSKILDELATSLKASYPGHELSIEGHTDDQPIKESGWRSNWELGAARALTVLHYMRANYGFQGDLMSATTYSEFRPVVGNEDSGKRNKNRRAVIVVKPKKSGEIVKAMTSEPIVAERSVAPLNSESIPAEEEILPDVANLEN